MYINTIIKTSTRKKKLKFEFLVKIFITFILNNLDLKKSYLILHIYSRAVTNLPLYI